VEAAMFDRFLRSLLVLALVSGATISSAWADDRAALQPLREEMWVLMTPLPMFALVIRPVGGGPFPLAVMNHGIAIGEKERSFFPTIEFRDAAFWFARHGYFVVSPIRYGVTAINAPQLGIHSLFFASVGSCDDPNFFGPGMMIATLDQWIIDFMEREGMVMPGKSIVIGQSGGGWGAIALSSLNPSSVRAIITFAAGRGGRVDGKPNNNCAPDKLVEQTAEFGRTSRVPMLWIYSENDTYFGPDLAKRMHQAFTGAGGKAAFNMLPPFGSDGHFMIDAAEAIPIWSPLVSQFLDEHQ
jgi:dienelactone hydrolase